MTKLQLRNSEEAYGWPAKLLHWLLALAIIGMLCLGLYMVSLPNNLGKLKLYGLHKSTGITIFAFMLFRFLWREVNHEPRIPRENKSGIVYSPVLHQMMERFAKFWHLAIYLVVFLMPVTGLLMSNAYGFPVSFFGWFTMPSLLPPNKNYADWLRLAHEKLAFILIFLVSVHILAALFHHFIIKDIVMKRMLPLIIFILLSAPALAAGKFEVDKAKSSIQFQATQNGAPAVGEFKAYTAQINFDPKDLKTSHVVINIEMGSVYSTYDELVSTLKTAEWFDVSKFPDAKFEASEFTFAGADKSPVYKAKGNLTMHGITRPVEFSFALSQYDAKHAAINGDATIKRSDFNIGWKDVSAVKDEVKITVHLEASGA